MLRLDPSVTLGSLLCPRCVAIAKDNIVTTNKKGSPNQDSGHRGCRPQSCNPQASQRVTFSLLGCPPRAVRRSLSAQATRAQSQQAHLPGLIQVTNPSHSPLCAFNTRDRLTSHVMELLNNRYMYIARFAPQINQGRSRARDEEGGPKKKSRLTNPTQRGFKHRNLQKDSPPLKITNAMTLPTSALAIAAILGNIVCSGTGSPHPSHCNRFSVDKSKFILPFIIFEPSGNCYGQ